MSCLETGNNTKQHVLCRLLRDLLKNLMYWNPSSILISRGQRSPNDSQFIKADVEITMQQWHFKDERDFCCVRRVKTSTAFYYLQWATLLGDIFLSSLNINVGILTGFVAQRQLLKRIIVFRISSFEQESSVWSVRLWFCGVHLLFHLAN